MADGAGFGLGAVARIVTHRDIEATRVEVLAKQASRQREADLGADRIGLGYVVQAGYRSSAMASLIDRLRQQAQLEAKLLGEAPDSFDQRSATSTHPAPFERKRALSAGDAAVTGESARPAYLAAIDGMSVDDAPDEGFVHGRAFLHPKLRLAFEAPADFRLFNDPDGVDSDFHLSMTRAEIASVTVKNTGRRAGATVVQLYIRDVAASVVRPVKELKRFRKVTLKAGEQTLVRFSINEEDLKFFNAQLQHLAEPGEFEVQIGLDSQAVQSQRFELL